MGLVRRTRASPPERPGARLSTSTTPQRSKGSSRRSWLPAGFCGVPSLPAAAPAPLSFCGGLPRSGVFVRLVSCPAPLVALSDALPLPVDAPGPLLLPRRAAVPGLAAGAGPAPPCMRSPGAAVPAAREAAAGAGDGCRWRASAGSSRALALALACLRATNHKHMSKTGVEESPAGCDPRLADCLTWKTRKAGRAWQMACPSHEPSTRCTCAHLGFQEACVALADGRAGPPRQHAGNLRP